MNLCVHGNRPTRRCENDVMTIQCKQCGCAVSGPVQSVENAWHALSTSRLTLHGAIDLVISAAMEPLFKNQIIERVMMIYPNTTPGSIKSTLSTMKERYGWRRVNQKRAARWEKS